MLCFSKHEKKKSHEKQNYNKQCAGWTPFYFHALSSQNKKEYFVCYVNLRTEAALFWFNNVDYFKQNGSHHKCLLCLEQCICTTDLEDTFAYHVVYSCYTTP